MIVMREIQLRLAAEAQLERAPLHGSSGFDPHTHWSWKVAIKLSHHVAFVLQSRLHYLACGAVQRRQRLLASVQITSYNSHLGLLRSELC
jgi:hypothetical protein